MIYVIQCGKEGPIKIGVAVDPVERLRALQTANHEKLHLLASMSGDRSREAQIHRALSQYRMNGEWFEPHESVFAFIATLQNVEYETDAGQNYAVLRRPDKESPCAACPFCGKAHWHGEGDGHRVAHCITPSHPKVVASDGTKLSSTDGYVVRTGVASGAT